MLCAFFWVIPPASELYMPTFRNTLFHLHRQVGMKILHTYLPIKMEQTECFETSAYKIQTPGNYPEDSIQHNIIFYFIVTFSVFPEAASPKEFPVSTLQPHLQSIAASYFIIILPKTHTPTHARTHL